MGNAPVFLTYLFILGVSLIAQADKVERDDFSYYKTISSRTVISPKVFDDPNKECKTGNVKDHTCEEYDSVLDAKALIFDCKLVKDQCTPGEQIQNSKSGLKYRYVGFFQFNDKNPKCTATDMSYPKHLASYIENAKVLLRKELADVAKPPSSVYESIETYLNVPFDNPNREHRKDNRADCFMFKHGWALDSYLKKIPKENLPIFNYKPAPQLHCDLCDDAEIKSLSDYRESQLVRDKNFAASLMEAVNNEAKHSRNDDGRAIASCNGVINLPALYMTYRKNGRSCDIDFPDDCGDSEVPYLSKVEQIANTILISAPESTRYNEKCKSALADFGATCGEEPASFSDTYKQIKTTLSAVKKTNGVTAEKMMCIYSRETTDFDPSKVNFEVCEQKNPALLSKPGVENPEDRPLKGRNSTACGLGQVVMETACYTIQRYPDEYPEVDTAKLKALRCTTPQAMNVIKNFFLESCQDKEKQVRLSTGALRMKVEDAGMDGAVKSYGDPCDGNYVPFVSACQLCFKSSNVAKCIQDTRRSHPKDSDSYQACRDRMMKKVSAK